MNPGADVNSIPILAEWYAALTNYQTEATESLSSVAMTIQHADAWLDEKLSFWQRERSEAEQEVAQAQAELRSRQFQDFSGRIPDCTVQEENLRMAEARYDHAEDQIKVVRRWVIQLPRLVNETYEGQARRLSRFLEGDLSKALAQLDQQIRSLEAYVAMRPPG